jgi:threonine/homoserine/homoserine lactone efflux protein
MTEFLATVFYMAFFPLFIDPATHRGLPTFALMAATIAAITAAYCLALSAGARAVSRQVTAHARLARGLQRLAGVFLIGFGWRLPRD